ncbi:MAG: alpha/beta hydrolase [Hungatella sp.]|nr:alpha/beta hydrolase [Hungatella sp.]
MKLLTWELPRLQSENGGEEAGRATVAAYLLDWQEGEQKRMRPAVVICPGGGYHKLSEREGEPVAMEYLAMGYHAFVLRYTVAPGRFPQGLLELASLVAHIRDHGEEWGVDPAKVVVSGFSAGGHLACSLGVFWNREFVYGPIGRRAEEIRPDGMILCYPVITSGAYCHPGSFENLLGEEAGDEKKRRLVSLEMQAGPHTPKTFLWHTAKDATVPVQNALLFAEALAANGVNVEFHLFPSGGHGLSLAREDTSRGEESLVEPRCQCWIRLAGEWMKNL